MAITPGEVLIKVSVNRRRDLGVADPNQIGRGRFQHIPKNQEAIILGGGPRYLRNHRAQDFRVF
jgi:hypothetical protein